ncbi:MAG: hypothetical protein NZV14_15210 [Bryobacteraceae bacterium]|nr:hypothetical protein [Bryobacteraceae bacterium]MDW8379512.1 hypothetical protein [Bryobacterales bacterium]
MGDLKKACWIAALAVAVVANAQPPATPSLDPRLKFKDGDRYLRDLAAALEIPRDSICKELGQYDCYFDAFRIVLGGVEPYTIRIVEPLPPSLTTPIALDRVALRVCATRVTADEKEPDKAVLLRPARKFDARWRRETAALLYEKLLRRPASSEEISRLTEFYKTVASELRAPAERAARDWVVLGCFAVATSLESIFY